MALEQDLARYPVVAVMGARQVGKSTLCRQLADARRFAYCTLDERDALEAAKRDPEGLLDELGVPAVIDEVQRAPSLFLAIKAIVDREGRPGMYLLSGSNQPRVSGAVAETLLGRAAYRTLRPLTLAELRDSEEHRGWSFLLEKDEAPVLTELQQRADSSGRLDWREVVATGGFPRAVAASPEYRGRLLDDYVQTFANRDIREIIGIERIDRFEAFLRLCAARVGQPLNISGLAADVGVGVNTAGRWLDALKRSYLFELVPAYSRNAGHRIIKAPKLFAVDPAFALAAARQPVPTGFYLENLVACDLAVWKDLHPGRAVSYWRKASGQEVDFVLEEGGRLLPVEIKATSRVGRGDTRQLRRFLELHETAQRALLLSGDPEIRMLVSRVVAAPWWAVL